MTNPVQFSSVQLLSRVQLFATPWNAARQSSLSITNCWSLPKPMSIESVMPSNHLILCHPLLLLPSVFLQNWRGSLRFLRPLEMRPSSIAPQPVEYREAPTNSTVSLSSHRHNEKLPEVTGGQVHAWWEWECLPVAGGREGWEPLLDHAGESSLLSRSGGEKGLR